MCESVESGISRCLELEQLSVWLFFSFNSKAKSKCEENPRENSPRFFEVKHSLNMVYFKARMMRQSDKKDLKKKKQAKRESWKEATRVIHHSTNPTRYSVIRFILLQWSLIIKKIANCM